MSHTPHELAADFPEFTEQMAQLRERDAHFARLTDEYHLKNREVHRAETDVEPTDDLHLTELRRERLRLKDEIYAYLKKA